MPGVMYTFIEGVGILGVKIEYLKDRELDL